MILFAGQWCELFYKLSSKEAKRFSPAWFRSKRPYHFSIDSGRGEWMARRSGQYLYVTTAHASSEFGYQVYRVDSELFRCAARGVDDQQVRQMVSEDIFHRSCLKQEYRDECLTHAEHLCDALSELAGIESAVWRRAAFYLDHEPGVGSVRRPLYPELQTD